MWLYAKRRARGRRFQIVDGGPYYTSYPISYYPHYLILLPTYFMAGLQNNRGRKRRGRPGEGETSNDQIRPVTSAASSLPGSSTQEENPRMRMRVPGDASGDIQMFGAGFL